jgi:hypothetical protein
MEIEMTITPSHVVVPYSEFLQRRERRGRVAAELGRQDAQRTIDAEAVAVSVVKPQILPALHPTLHKPHGEGRARFRLAPCEAGADAGTEVVSVADRNHEMD